MSPIAQLPIPPSAAIDLDTVVALTDRLPAEFVDLSAVGDALAASGEVVGDVASDVVELAVDVGTDAAASSVRVVRRFGRAAADHPRTTAGVVVALGIGLATGWYLRSRRHTEPPVTTSV